MSVHDSLIARYENGVAALEDALGHLAEELLDRVPAPGKWTIRQQAAHVADAELVMCARIRWIAAEPGSPLQSFDQDNWAGALGYVRQRPEDSLQLFGALRRSTAALLRRLPEPAWTQTGVHQERGAVTLAAMVELCAAHAEHHAARIRELRAKFAAEP